ncbi:hypothetical protein [Pseudochrobactrum sp. MP213Fo]|uniref:hypothetical protein n=1 Tax=Pseudochrobactrum sp. MP213Fo TaxID=3022250 RepID=UPI003BA1E013
MNFPDRIKPKHSYGKAGLLNFAVFYVILTIIRTLSLDAAHGNGTKRIIGRIDCVLNFCSVCSNFAVFACNIALRLYMLQRKMLDEACGLNRKHSIAFCSSPVAAVLLRQDGTG